MKRIIVPFLGLLLIGGIIQTADVPAKPMLKIIPGKVIVPTDAMRRIWGELVSLDLATRTGKFRNETNDEVMSFIVMPYAELLHHATNGDLQDFRTGERAIFRLHQNEKGDWVWLTYIQDEMNMMNNHKEYFYVDAIDSGAGSLTCMWANFDKSFIREKAVTVETDKETRFWKAGQPAKFGDIKIGDRLRTKTRGTGSGKHRVAWEVFLDDESLLKFQSEQKAVHAARIKEQGAPGYVDESNGQKLVITIFSEADEQVKTIKNGSKVRVSPAGVDRKPTATPVATKVSNVGKNGRQTAVTLELEGAAPKFEAAGLARLWLDNN